MSPEELLSRKEFNVIVSTTMADKEIKQILLDGGYPQDQVYSLIEYYKYEDPDQYFSPDFMYYGEEEILIDAGCLNLASSLVFKKHCKHVKRIYAFEPDPECYQICLERKRRESLSEAELFHGASGEHSTLRQPQTELPVYVRMEKTASPSFPLTRRCPPGSALP